MDSHRGSHLINGRPSKYWAFALNDTAYGPSGITIEDADGNAVAAQDKPNDGHRGLEQWDELLETMGYRLTAEWQWLSPQFVAPVEPA